MDITRQAKLKEMVVGLFFAVLLILAYSYRNIDAQNLALGKDTFSVFERQNGKPFTAYSPELIRNLIEGISASSSAQEVVNHWLWLGNSQLHAINQLKQGDHLAPYWTRESLPCPDCIVPLGISVPNANLQEYLLLSQYVESKLKIKGMIIELPFIGLREDGIRDELDVLVGQCVRDSLSKSQAGGDVLKFVDISESNGKALGTGQNVEKKDTSFQANMENGLETIMGQYFPIWKKRRLLKATFLVDLYFFKNWLFGIKPNSIRKVILPRYERNMMALEDILKRSRNEGISTIVYIAPIRQDIQLPYDAMEYGLWKDQVEKLVAMYDGRFLNLEKLVPVQHWGTYGVEDIDFMHFQGSGHQIVGHYMAKYLAN